MPCPTLAELPPPPPGRIGWPWTTECSKLPSHRADGSHWPRISIVTPSYNQGQFLEETIRSILLQGYPDLEYMIMDGGSTDGSVEILTKYARWLDCWRSKKDGGQAQAINEALERASGHWFHNVNSDDVLEAGALAIIGQAKIDIDFVAGSVINFTNTHTLEQVQNYNLSTYNLLVSYGISNFFRWHQPGVIFRTNYLKNIGGYVEKFTYTFDFYSTCIYLELYPNGNYLKDIVCRFRIHVSSKTSNWGDRHILEDLESRKLLCTTLRSNKLRGVAKRESTRRLLQIQFRQIDNGSRFANLAETFGKAFFRYPSLMLDRITIGILIKSIMRSLKIK